MTQFYHAVQQSFSFDFSDSVVPTKVCKKCEIEKPIEEFHKEKGSPDGRRATCKQCRAEAIRESQLNPKVKPIPQPGHRFCTKCEIEKPLEAFHAHPRGAFGRDPMCKDCRSAYHVVRKQRDPERLKERNRLWRRKDREKRPEYYEDLYLKNKEEYRERDRAYRKAKPEKVREKNLRRKSSKLKAKVEAVDYKAIIDQYGYHCYLCNKPIDPTAKSRTTAGLTFDHVVPLTPRPGEPQGSHTADNIRPAHHACNVRKGNIPLDQLTPWQRRGI